MASFQNMVITTAGLKLLQDLILEGGTPLTFSGVGVGDGLLEDSDITARTSLVHEVHRLPIEKIEKQEGGHIRVFARLATDIITTDFYHRELGVFARHGEQEILFAYGNAGDDYDFIPATGNNASICKTIVTEFTVGSMKAVFLPLDSKDFVTHESMNAQVEEVIIRETRKVLNAIPQVDAAGNMTLAGGLTVTGAVNANGGVNAVAMLAPGLPKTGLNAGAAAVMAALGNVYHLDHVNGTITTLEGSNVKMEYILQGWCGVSWVGTSTMHKCLLIKAGQSNSNYCGAWSPMGTSDYALVMSYLSGVNMVDTSTKFGWTGYSGTVAATTIEDIPGPAFYTDCVNKKVVAKNAAGETTELPWTGISLDQVSRLDFIVVPSSLTSCKIYLSIHPSVRTAHGNHYNFNRRYLTPQSYYIGEVPVGLTGNDCHYAVLDNNSEQMALFRVSVIQGINPADYLNIENI